MASQPLIEEETDDLILDDVDPVDDGQGGDTPQDDGEVDIHFEDETPVEVQSETPLVAHLRKQLRDAQKRASAPKVEAATQLGPRPTLEQFDYDDDAFDKALETWIESKSKVDAEARKLSDRWEGKLRKYETDKVALAKPDYDDVADMANATFTDLQRSLILNGSENAAKFMYAVGKSPTKLSQLAGITDPIEFLAAVVRAEGKIAMTTRRPPEPEYIPTGSSAPSQGRAKDAEEARLEREFEKTGDGTALFRYRREKRKAA